MARSPKSLATRLTRTTGLQLMLVAGSLSIFSFSLGRHSGIQQSEAHRSNIPVVQVSEQLSRKLSYPTIINDLNQAAITADPELLTNFDKLSHRFWRQLRSFPVDYINYGSADGSFLGIEKRDDSSLFHNEDSDRFGRGTLMIYAMSDKGERLQREEAIPGMSEFHEEAWYTDTAKAGEPTWSRIYAWEDQPGTFSISYNAPIFNSRKQLLGVVGVDMTINKLSTWLQEAWKPDKGLALIAEANGDLIASSKENTTFTQTGNLFERTNIQSLKLPLARELHNKFFQAKDGKTLINPDKIDKAPTLARINQRDYLIKATPWGQSYGLNWYLLTASQADAEWSTSQRNLILFLSISLTALLIALAINKRLIAGLLTPLTALRDASLSTKEQIQQEEHEGGCIAPVTYSCNLKATQTLEILDLNQAIQSMVEGFNRLNQTIKEQDERELTAMSEKLKVSLEAASIAHEINQPLSIVRLTAHNLLHSLMSQDRKDLPSDLHQGLTTLNAESERIATISDKIRALLRNAESNRCPVDLHQVIEGSIRYAQSNIPGGQWIEPLKLMSVNAGEAVITGDPVQLQLALINLVRNALDALTSQARNQDDRPRVRVSLQEQHESWQICVDDNGPGLPEEKRSSLPLHTTKADGTGLGLFIVRTALESHGGQLELTTGPLGGLQARMTLPKGH